MSFRDMYSGNSKHLKAQDIKGKGDVPVTIDRWEQVDFDDGPKLVVGFAGKDKTVVLNKTNYESIADAYGDHPDGWKGKACALYVVKVNFNGQMVDGLRIRPTQAATPAPQRQDEPPPPEHEHAGGDFDDEIPFSPFEHGRVV